jgi:hypothetical protein
MLSPILETGRTRRGFRSCPRRRRRVRLGLDRVEAACARGLEIGAVMAVTNGDPTMATGRRRTALATTKADLPSPGDGPGAKLARNTRHRTR